MPPTTRVSLRVTYEVSSDVLLATSEPPRAAVSDERVADLFLRLDPGDGEIVGFECLEFSRRVQDPARVDSLPDVGTFWVDARSLTLAAALQETWAAITARPFEVAVEFVGRHT